MFMWAKGSLDLQSYRQLDNNTSGIWSALHKNKVKVAAFGAPYTKHG